MFIDLLEWENVWVEPHLLRQEREGKEIKDGGLNQLQQRANLTISAFTLQIVTVSLREWKVAISSGNDWRNGGSWTQNRPVSLAGNTDARETSP